MTQDPMTTNAVEPRSEVVATDGAEQTNSAPFCYVYRWNDKHKRKGEKVAILGSATARVVTVKFKDGTVIRISRNAVIRSSPAKV